MVSYMISIQSIFYLFIQQATLDNRDFINRKQTNPDTIDLLSGKVFNKILWHKSILSLRVKLIKLRETTASIYCQEEIILKRRKLRR